ncbi:MAG: hypothetical protein RJA36_212 [Pseudomonadota bacterium]|jgi:type IV pilus assembly protein PilV
MKTHLASPAEGFSMIEVLVTIIILTVGILGLFGLSTRLQLHQLEAYQRAQALILLKDMENRIAANPLNAANYVTGVVTPIASNSICPSASTTPQEKDFLAWCSAILGAGETYNDSNAGALIHGLGCIEAIGNNQYLVTVAWQGMGALGSPPGSTCGVGAYNAVSGCANDACRRTVSTTVRIANLATP